MWDIPLDTHRCVTQISALICPLPLTQVQLKGDEEQSVFVSPVGADSVKRGYLYAKDFDDLVRCVEAWKYGGVSSENGQHEMLMRVGMWGCEM